MSLWTCFIALSKYSFSVVPFSANNSSVVIDSASILSNFSLNVWLGFRAIVQKYKVISDAFRGFAFIEVAFNCPGNNVQSFHPFGGECDYSIVCIGRKFGKKFLQIFNSHKSSNYWSNRLPSRRTIFAKGKTAYIFSRSSGK